MKQALYFVLPRVPQHQRCWAALVRVWQASTVTVHPPAGPSTAERRFQQPAREGGTAHPKPPHASRGGGVAQRSEVSGWTTMRWGLQPMHTPPPPPDRRRALTAAAATAVAAAGTAAEAAAAAAAAAAATGATAGSGSSGSGSNSDGSGSGSDSSGSVSSGSGSSGSRSGSSNRGSGGGSPVPADAPPTACHTARRRGPTACPRHANPPSGVKDCYEASARQAGGGGGAASAVAPLSPTARRHSRARPRARHCPRSACDESDGEQSRRKKRRNGIRTPQHRAPSQSTAGRWGRRGRRGRRVRNDTPTAGGDATPAGWPPPANETQGGGGSGPCGVGGSRPRGTPTNDRRRPVVDDRRRLVGGPWQKGPWGPRSPPDHGERQRQRMIRPTRATNRSGVSVGGGRGARWGGWPPGISGRRLLQPAAAAGRRHHQRPPLLAAAAAVRPARGPSP